MKIGILTLPPRVNYGGILQIYALQSILERMGHEVIVFDIEKKWLLSIWKAPLHYAKRFVNRYVFGSKGIVVFAERRRNEEYPIISALVQPFIDKYLKCVAVKLDMKMFNEKDFDAIIVGSDQIWRPKYCYWNIEHAYLYFTEKWNIKRISYAASFGTNKWEYTKKQTKRCKELIRAFDSVSVRESSGVTLCKKYLSINACHVLDPTMLLEKEAYSKLFEMVGTSRSKGNLMVYMLDSTEDKEKVVERIAQVGEYVPFISNNSHILDFSLDIENRIVPSVESWLRGFYDAEFVVTDSFHACVFSILYNKPFIVYGNKERGIARMLSLLEMFDLEERLIYSLTDIDCRLIKGCVNWKSVNAKLEEARHVSIDFLKKNLRNN